MREYSNESWDYRAKIQWMKFRGLRSDDVEGSLEIRAPFDIGDLASNFMPDLV